MRFPSAAHSPHARDRLRASCAIAAAAVCSLGGGAIFIVMLGEPVSRMQAAPAPIVETTGSAPPSGFAHAYNDDAVQPDVASDELPLPAIKSEPVSVEPPKPADPAASDSVDKTAAFDCDEQTWPYITPQCLAEQGKTNRKVRVISTDRLAPLVVRALEGPASEPAYATPDREVEHTGTMEAASAGSPPSAQLASDPNERAGTASEPPPEASRQAAQDARKKSLRDKRRRQAKRRAAGPERAARYGDRRRTVERWSEREYDVPAYDGTGRRRVIVGGRFGEEPYLPPVGSYSRPVFGY